MSNHTKKHTDTEAFGKVSSATYQAILDTIPLIGAVLNWEPLACAFLAEVLRHLPLNGDLLVISHVDFARLLWGEDMTKEAARRRIGRCVQALKRCQAMSGFLAVWVDVGKRVERGGALEFFQTSYRLREFFILFRELRVLAVEQDLMALPIRERKQTQLAIIQSLCDARQYQRIPARARQQRHFQAEEKKPEPLPKVEKAPGALPAMTYTKAEDWFLEQLQSHLISLGKVDGGFNAVINGLSKKIRLVEREALDVIHGRKKGASK